MVPVFLKREGESVRPYLLSAYNCDAEWCSTCHRQVECRVARALYLSELTGKGLEEYLKADLI